MHKKRFGIVLLLALAVFGIYLGTRTARRSAYPRGYAPMIEEQSAKAGVDTMLLYAVVRCESGFDPEAVSSVGARGLMQLTEDTFDWVCWRLGEERSYDEAFDPEINLRFGTYLLAYLLDRFQDEATALAAYHAGSGIVGQWLLDERYSSDQKTLHTIPYEDTARYVPRVLKTKEIYIELYGKG